MNDRNAKQSSSRILLVDDDPIVINTLRTGLSQAGYTVDAFLEGEAALNHFKTTAPDLAVLDIMLPDILGTELAARMMEFCYRPIIILSGHSDQDIVNRAIDRGVFGYLVKPISAKQLIPSIETALVRCRDVDRRIAEHFGETSLDNAQINALLDRFFVGLVVIDHQRNVIYQNQVAKSIIDNKGLIVNRGGQLRTAHTRYAHDLSSAIEGALDGRDKPGIGALTLHDDNGRTIHIWIAPLGTTDNLANAIVTIIDPDQPIPAFEPLLKTLYGLTNKECSLTIALLNGKTIDEYCDLNHVSPNTARTHLKSIYRKTNTNRQVDLVRVLSRLFASVNPEIYSP